MPDRPGQRARVDKTHAGDARLQGLHVVDEDAGERDLVGAVMQAQYGSAWGLAVSGLSAPPCRQAQGMRLRRWKTPQHAVCVPASPGTLACMNCMVSCEGASCATLPQYLGGGQSMGKGVPVSVGSFPRSQRLGMLTSSVEEQEP